MVVFVCFEVPNARIRSEAEATNDRSNEFQLNLNYKFESEGYIKNISYHFLSFLIIS